MGPPLQFDDHGTPRHQVIVVADHGSLSQAYTYQHANATLAVVFSGNHQKADDVLAQLCGIWFTRVYYYYLYHNDNNNLVVTADTELKSHANERFLKQVLCTATNEESIF
jgi:hypothetical protein